MIPSELQSLERYTRIKNRVLQHCCILDLTEQYKTVGSSRIYFLDEVHDYLPPNVDFGGNEATLVRPEFMLDSVEHYITSNGQGKPDPRQTRELALLLTDKVKIFSR